MWMTTLGGNLINTDYVIAFRSVKTDDENKWRVEGVCAASVLRAQVFVGSKDQCERVLAELLKQLHNKDIDYINVKDLIR